jgi:hypothetical protein
MKAKLAGDFSHGTAAWPWPRENPLLVDTKSFHARFGAPRVGFLPPIGYGQVP